MRNAIPKIFLHVIFMLFSFYSYSQNKTIDSLKKILATEKEDTNKENTLYSLGEQIKFTNNDSAALIILNTAISLAKK